ncbi:MAG TPA: hypothetical protein PK668_07555 [Myxococcota bacterium]|nr:hypothetical protein [Myxococcota bacterium]HRY92299.1 hypothetical protein [Myxococcota bacterium]
MKTKPWTHLLLACAGLGLALAGGFAQASVAERLGLADLSARAERVVVAHLARASTAWDASGRRMLTTFEFAVEQDLSGAGPAAFQIVQPGGAIGRWAQVAHGYPTFEPEEPLLLFLEQRTGRAPGLRVVGLSQGVFALEARDGELRLRQRLSGLDFPGADARPLELGWDEAVSVIRAARRAAGVAP